MMSKKVETEVLDQLWHASFRKQGYSKLQVASGSMTPLINIGDRVRVVAIKNPKDVRVGDIVLFKFKGHYLVHRIVGKLVLHNELYFRQKGDAGMNSEILPADRILGKVIAIEKPRGVIHLDGVAGKSINLFMGMCFAVVDNLYRGARKVRRFLFTREGGSAAQWFIQFVNQIFWKAQKVFFYALLMVQKAITKR